VIDPAQEKEKEKDVALELKWKRMNNAIEALLRVPKQVLRSLRINCPLSFVSSSSSSSSASSVSAGASLLKWPQSLFSSSPYRSEIWTCGQNSYGELGHGDVSQRRCFSRVALLDDKAIIGVGAGNEHTVFVTRDGKLLVTGYNDSGQCGVGNTTQVRAPVAVSSLDGENIAQVHVYNGCEHTLVVTKEGKLYAFGYNYRGQLGLGNTSSEAIPRPVKSLGQRQVVLAACSYHHSIVLCADGALFSFGRNDSGQLGHGDSVDKKVPHLVQTAPKGVVSVSCGQFHSILVTKSGTILYCTICDTQLQFNDISCALMLLHNLLPELNG